MITPVPLFTIPLLVIPVVDEASHSQDGISTIESCRNRDGSIVKVSEILIFAVPLKSAYGV
jgi:hypothetical protein